MEFPPQTPQPNVYPLSWHAQTMKLEEIWDAAQRENWDPKKLPWDTLDVDSYSWEEREAIGYWWTLLSVFDASAPPVFASALIKTYEEHEEDPVRRCFFSITRDEQNHEQSRSSSITTTRSPINPRRNSANGYRKTRNGSTTTVAATGTGTRTRCRSIRSRCSSLRS